MIKRDELSNPNSCLNKAEPDEIVFVLRAKDESAPVAIQAWINHRLETGKNFAHDQKILDAQECIQMMQEYRFNNQPEPQTIQWFRIGLGNVIPQKKPLLCKCSQTNNLGTPQYRLLYNFDGRWYSDTHGTVTKWRVTHYALIQE